MDKIKNVKGKLNGQVLTILVVLLALCVILSILSPYFLQSANLINVVSQVTVNATIAIGMTFVILTGGIDLSVGAMLALSGILMGLAMRSGAPTIVLLIIGITIGGVCGLLNGVMVTLGKLPPFIATLGMMQVARGLTLLISGGRNFANFPEIFRWIGLGTVFNTPIPMQVVFMIIFYFIAYYLLRFRKLGRYVYAIGGNEEAARLCGIKVFKYKTISYFISGITAGLAAIILTSKLNAAQSAAGMGYELDAVAAAVIGGTSLSGGVGSIWGTLIGAIIMQVIKNGLNLLNASSYLQQVVIGLVMIFAVLLDSLRKKN